MGPVRWRSEGDVDVFKLKEGHGDDGVKILNLRWGNSKQTQNENVPNRFGILNFGIFRIRNSALLSSGTSVIEGDEPLEDDHDAIEEEADDAHDEAGEDDVGEGLRGAVLVFIPDEFPESIR